MKFFGRKRAGITLVRAWCSPFDEEGPAGELLALVDQVLASIPALALEGSINYGYTQPMSSLRRALAKLKPAQLDALLVQDEAGEVICSFGAEGASVGDRSRAFEIFALLPPAAVAAQDQLLRLLMGHRMHYGYARALGADFNPLSEAPIRRGFFDSSIEVDGGRSDWLVPEIDVRAGAVRGLYPANVFSTVASHASPARGCSCHRRRPASATWSGVRRASEKVRHPAGEPQLSRVPAFRRRLRNAAFGMALRVVRGHSAASGKDTQMTVETAPAEQPSPRRARSR